MQLLVLATDIYEYVPNILDYFDIGAVDDGLGPGWHERTLGQNLAYLFLNGAVLWHRDGMYRGARIAEEIVLKVQRCLLD